MVMDEVKLDVEVGDTPVMPLTTEDEYPVEEGAVTVLRRDDGIVVVPPTVDIVLDVSLETVELGYRTEEVDDD
jgi:hypothetical protein